MLALLLLVKANLVLLRKFDAPEEVGQSSGHRNGSGIFRTGWQRSARFPVFGRSDLDDGRFFRRRRKFPDRLFEVLVLVGVVDAVAVEGVDAAVVRQAAAAG